MPELAPLVTTALKAAQLRPEDVAAAGLAQRYAELLDEAAVSQQYAEALRLVGEALDTRNPLVLKAWDRVQTALSEHTTASDLGPKLLATLTALGCSLAGRKALTEKGGGTVHDLPESPLKQLRDEARQRNAKAVS